jgi:hypothetical protein
MKHTDFNRLLSSVNTLSPDQMRHLRQRLDDRRTGPAQPLAPSSSKAANRAKTPQKTLSIEDLHRQMMARGLIRRLPDPSLDIDDDGPEDQPVPIEGEPLSETILRARE